MSTEEDLITAADALYDSVHTRVFRDEFRAIYLGFHRAPAVTIYDGDPASSVPQNINDKHREAFRKPFMVEAYTVSPHSGPSDPWHRTFRSLEEARDQAASEEADGAFATIYRRTLEDGYEEVGL